MAAKDERSQNAWWLILGLFGFLLASLSIMPLVVKKRSSAEVTSLPTESDQPHGRVEMREVEPNGEVEQANPLPFGRAVQGDIADNADTDIFRVVTSAAEHALLNVKITNASPGLKPELAVLNANSFRLNVTWNQTAGGDLTLTFSVAPNAVYYFAVYGAEDSTGKYSLTAEQKATTATAASAPPKRERLNLEPVPGCTP